MEPFTGGDQGHRYGDFNYLFLRYMGIESFPRPPVPPSCARTAATPQSAPIPHPQFGVSSPCSSTPGALLPRPPCRWVLSELRAPCISSRAARRYARAGNGLACTYAEAGKFEGVGWPDRSVGNPSSHSRISSHTLDMRYPSWFQPVSGPQGSTLLVSEWGIGFLERRCWVKQRLKNSNCSSPGA